MGEEKKLVKVKEVSMIILIPQGAELDMSFLQQNFIHTCSDISLIEINGTNFQGSVHRIVVTQEAVNGLRRSGCTLICIISAKQGFIGCFQGLLASLN